MYLFIWVIHCFHLWCWSGQWLSWQGKHYICWSWVSFWCNYCVCCHWVLEPVLVYQSNIIVNTGTELIFKREHNKKLSFLWTYGGTKVNDVSTHFCGICCRKKSVLTRQQENGVPKARSGRKVSTKKRGIFYTQKSLLSTTVCRKKAGF